MDAYFSTKDMCRIFDVGRETLRHYENIGLLSPEIDPENGYRHYGYWDIGTMIDILKLRSVGLSLKDTKQAMYGVDFKEIVASLHDQMDEYSRQLTHFTMLQKKMTIDIQYLSYVDGQFGVLHEMDIEPLFYIECPNPPPTEDAQLQLHKVLQNCQFFSTSWWFTPDIDSSFSPDGLGFATETEFSDYLDIKGGRVFPKNHAVGTVLDLKGRVQICRECLKDFESEVTSKYPNASADTHVILMSRFTDKEGLLHQYVFAYKELT